MSTSPTSRAIHTSQTLITRSRILTELVTSAGVANSSTSHADGSNVFGLDRHLSYLQSQVLSALKVSAESSDDAPHFVPLIDLLVQLGHLHGEVRKEIDRARTDRTAAVRHEIALLRKLRRSDDLLARVCQSVVQACGFDRAMLSRIDGSTWYPWKTFSRASTTTDNQFREWMEEIPAIRLEHMMLESEMVRRHEPAIVVDGRTDRRIYSPFRIASGLTSYVAAPLMSDGRVIGLLHADYDQQTVNSSDREALWEFAEAFGRVFERCVMLERLSNRSTRVRSAMHTIENLLDELATEEIALLPVAPGPEAPPTTQRTVVSEAIADSRWQLTPRELEVLSLMATGATNGRIAEQLVITDGTVKSHVKKILRKLRTDNRGAAIALYLRSTIAAPLER